MSWKQVKPFQVGKAGTKKYWCLQNVRLGFGAPVKWEYARQDWEHNLGRHPNQDFPAGVAVPVYFSWTGTLDGVKRDWGHVAVRLPDGRIWTDGKYYANVSTLASNYLSGGTYLGWGESVNGVRVVEYVPEPVRKSNEEIASEVIQGKWGNGQERKQRLTAAGYDYNAVQAIVNTKLSGSKPAPAPAKPELETYHLNQDVPGYRSSTDAINRRNSNSTVRKGVYKLSHRVKGADHLIRPDGSGGWWITI